MNLIEFITFIITMLLVIYLSARRANEQRKQLGNSNYDVDEEEQEFEEMVRVLNISPEDAMALKRELKGKASAPPPPPKTKKKKVVKKETKRILSDEYSLHAHLDEYEQHSRIEDRELNTAIEKRHQRKRKTIVTESLRPAIDIDPYATKYRGESRVKNLLSKLDSKKELIVIQEIVGLPKSLRNDEINSR